MAISTESGYPRPSFAEWLDRTTGYYLGAFGAAAADGVNARLAEMDAQMAHSLCAYLETEAKSCQVINATGARLRGWGQPLIGPVKSASSAGGIVRFWGSNGAIIAAGAVLTADDGVEYVVSTGMTVTGGFVDVPVGCTESGLSGNRSTGAVLTLISPVLGLDGKNGIAQAPGLTGGAETEDEVDYRGRVLARLRAVASGGNDQDYQGWALEVPGVSRAWVSRGDDGEVLVRVMMDSVYADGIPVGAGAPNYSGDLLRVYRHLLAKTPHPRSVYVAAPVPVPVAYIIGGLDPDTAEIRAAIEAELIDAHARRSRPGGVWRWSWGSEATAIAAGVDGFDAIAPTASIVCGPGEIAVFGGVTYD